jgi:hypothetical protein
MFAFLVLFTIIANIFGFAEPLVHGINSGLGLHLSGIAYFFILAILALFFD